MAAPKYPHHPDVGPPGNGGYHRPIPLGDDLLYLLVPVIPNEGPLVWTQFSWLPVRNVPTYRELADNDEKYYAVCGAGPRIRNDIAQTLAKTYNGALDCGTYDVRAQELREAAAEQAWYTQIAALYIMFGLFMAILIYPVHYEHRPGQKGSRMDRVFGGAKNRWLSCLGGLFHMILAIALWPLRLIWIFVWEAIALVWQRGERTGDPARQRPDLKKHLDRAPPSGKRWRQVQMRVAMSQPGLAAERDTAGEGHDDGNDADEEREPDIELNDMEAGRKRDVRIQENPFADPGQGSSRDSFDGGAPR